MMYQDPEKASDQDGEKIEEGEQPGKRELPSQIAACRCCKPNDQRNQKRCDPNRHKRKENPAYVPAMKGFGPWNP
jgi:hypothetical protein